MMIHNEKERFIECELRTISSQWILNMEMEKNIDIYLWRGDTVKEDTIVSELQSGSLRPSGEILHTKVRLWLRLAHT